jgi:hypothetical protein
MKRQYRIHKHEVGESKFYTVSRGKWFGQVWEMLGTGKGKDFTPYKHDSLEEAERYIDCIKRVDNILTGRKLTTIKTEEW